MCIRDRARAIHLGFALLLAFLVFPTFKRGKVNFIDIMIGIIGISCCLYIYFFYDDLIDRGGVLHILKYNNYSIPIELIIGSTGILILLEATRRVIGIPLVVIAVCFLLFSYYGQYAPEIISHGGLSLKRLVGFQWFDQEAIFGIPIGVSVDFIFLFVLFAKIKYPCLSNWKGVPISSFTADCSINAERVSKECLFKSISSSEVWFKFPEFCVNKLWYT